MDIFEEVKRRVPVPKAAERYGLQPNRAGFVRCPFHGEKTPSLKLWEDHWYCFGCHAHGSVIDLVGQLFELKPMEAARRLDGDFGLGLSRDSQWSEEDKALLRELRRFDAVRKAYEQWRREMLRKLCAVVRLGNQALQRPPETRTAEEDEAVRWAPALEYWLEKLEEGDQEAQMEIFRERKGIEERCGKILKNTLLRSNPV